MQATDKRTYGVVGAGIIPVEKLGKYRRKKAIVWRETGDKFEIWNYRLRKWLELKEESIDFVKLVKFADAD